MGYRYHIAGPPRLQPLLPQQVPPGFTLTLFPTEEQPMIVEEALEKRDILGQKVKEFNAVACQG
ncbi:hypothetical protein H257_10903 [Aphanomyces astaci]|uniref:Uncharacterized protein n=1 Tax=Aphanomyces astaci TaxID=112090 RepID=W4G718_APHAT|nr:hypothetical protein H257_10903 [Aphanomyces astaci]ETV74864.1 hypothetical protein H257_10903 [Aphanomyces astaci]|eukprot:XP_009835951.1 hypothetical protein H257_10903 [Aphanomyces astaci]